MSRLLQFFEGDNNALSMTRLLMFLAFFPATYVLMENSNSDNIDNLLAWYLGAFVLGYIGGKSAEAIRRPGTSE